MTPLKSDPSSDHTFADKYGPWALVTGAAQGIGSAYAEALAQRRLNLILVDKQEEPLRKVSEALQRQHAVDARAVAVDLSTPSFLDIVCRQTADLAVGLMVSNAALGGVGPFLNESTEDLRLAIDINCTAPVLLAHAFGKQMVARGRGGIIFMASGAAYIGSPFIANYAATKGYNLILGESLWYEFRQHGVDVLAFTPGPTNTPGLRRGRPGVKEGVAVGAIKLPAQSAEAALRLLGKAPSAARDLRMTLQIVYRTRILGRKRAIELTGDRQAKFWGARRT